MREYQQIIAQLTDMDTLDDTLARQHAEHKVVEGLLRRLIAQNAHKEMNQADHTRREMALQKRYEAAQREIAALEKQRNAQATQRIVRRFPQYGRKAAGFSDGVR